MIENKIAFTGDTKKLEAAWRRSYLSVYRFVWAIRIKCGLARIRTRPLIYTRKIPPE